MSLDVITLGLAKSYTNQHGGGSVLMDDDILDSLITTDMLSAVKDSDGKILTDETNKILLM